MLKYHPLLPALSRAAPLTCCKLSTDRARSKRADHTLPHRQQCRHVLRHALPTFPDIEIGRCTAVTSKYVGRHATILSRKTVSQALVLASWNCSCRHLHQTSRTHAHSKPTTSLFAMHPLSSTTTYVQRLNVKADDSPSTSLHHDLRDNKRRWRPAQALLVGPADLRKTLTQATVFGGDGLSLELGCSVSPAKTGD
jgi:hypothetical protein